jgi:hypothetical protein
MLNDDIISVLSYKMRFFVILFIVPGSRYLNAHITYVKTLRDL